MNSGTILIVALVSASLGYLVAIIISRQSKNEQPEKEITDNNQGPRFEVHHLNVILWSKTQHGPLLADVYGRTYHSRDEISPPEKNRLIHEIRTVEAWFGLTNLQPASTITPAPVSMKLEAPSPEAEPADASIPGIEPEAVQQVEPLAVLEKVEEPTPQAAHPPQPHPTDTPVPMVITEAQLDEIMPPPPVTPVAARLDNRSKIKEEPKSIVQQINDILQDKVTQSSFANAGIKLQETPQGVVVWIGNQSFQGIDSVPEGEAKGLIRAAVKQWEKG